jgi:hypothetical protein
MAFIIGKLIEIIFSSLIYDKSPHLSCFSIFSPELFKKTGKFLLL